MRPSTSDTALSGFERSLAVVIGINTYAHGIPALHNAVRDATAVADALERQGFEVIRLLDSQATLSSLSHLLSDHLPSLSSPPDRLLIYFAGHGLAHTDDQHQLSGFLLPSDACRDDTSSYWPMASLREALRHLPCRHLLLILDCCFAGAFPHPSSRDLRAPSQPAPLYLERFRHFSSRRSFQLLLSTAHDELASDRLLAKPAQESLGDGLHSPFALALLQGLQPPSPADTNQDGLLTAAELYTFLRDRLLSLVPSHCQQTPSLWHLDWHDGGEFLFLLSDSFPSLPPAAPLSQHSNPYLGLRPFSSAHRHLFFGRERLVDSLLDRLRAQPLLLLCGPSGAGKSSLVHAGLLPRLTEDPSWRVPPSLRPSSQPLHALSSWLSSLAPGDAAPSAAVLASQPRSAAEFLGSFLARHPERSVLLIIDPLEELVTACLDDSLRRAFLRALSSLLQLSHPRLHLLLLLRSDFEPHFLSLLQPSALPSALWHSGRLNLPPMNRDELRRCIEKPAEACVLFFSPGLVERLLDDVEQMPGALPLLSVALSELFGAYLASGRDDRTLSFEDYHHIGGGIAGALQRRAELVFSGTPPPSIEGQPALPPVPPSELPAFQRTLRNVLLRMVSPEGGELARRRVLRSELEYPHYEENARVQRALRALEASRLVVASDDGGPCVEPAHDALLSAWPRLHDWARHAQRELHLLRRVSHAASEWHRHTPDFLWADARLDQLGLAPASLRRTDVTLALPTASPGSQPTEPLAFNAAESGFLRASATRRRFLRTRRNALALTVAVTLVLLTVAALFQATKAKANADEALRQQEAAVASAWEARRQEEVAKTNASKAQKQEQLAKTNASEALRQQAAAEAHFKEARKQKETADANASEALRQQAAAEANAGEARKQQQLADTNAREALAQKSAAEANAREAQRQKEAAEFNSREAQKQQQIADINAREALLQKDTSETNAQEARKQQKSAEANAREARKQQQIAEANAQEALKQQQAAEANFEEARKQQKTADANAKEAQRQQEAAEANAREALKRKAAADASAKEAQKQKDLALASAQLTHAERLVQEDPTKALLVLLEVSIQDESSGQSWLQAALETSQRAISSVILRGHENQVYAAQFSPDGSRVLTASSDGTARLWNTDGTGEPLILKDNATGPWSFATFSPDGSRVLTASSDGTARLWNTDGTGEPLILNGHSVDITSATFSPDGSHVLTASFDGTARLWSTNGAEESLVFGGNASEMMSATFSPEGSRILTAHVDGTARIWRTDGTEEPIVLEGHMGTLTSATFSPDGSRVLTSSIDGTARLWSADGTGESFVFEGHMRDVTSATFSPDGSRILTASLDGTARIWSIDGFGEDLILEGHTDALTSATFSPDGSRVLTSSRDKTARLWRIDSPNVLLILEGHSSEVMSATFSPDGSRVLTSSRDKTARIWRIDSSTPLLFLDSPTDLVSATLNPDSSRILTAHVDGTARLWNTDGTGEHLIFEGHTSTLDSATFNPDGSSVLTASHDGTARVWRSDNVGESIVLKGHTSTLSSATFSPDGSRVLTASFDGIARIWRSDGTGAPLALKGHTDALTSATFSPDGSRVLTASFDGTARIWRSDGTGAPLVLVGHTDALTSATFSPDGSRVLTTSFDGTARLWSANGTGGSLVLAGHTGSVTSAVFSPDGSRILTASFDGTARLWSANGTGESLVLAGHTGDVTSAVFSPDGSRIITAARDGSVRLWQVDGRVPPLILQHEELSIKPLHAFLMPDGSRIVTVSGDGVMRIWSIEPNRLGNILRNATTACLSPDEREHYLLESASKAREEHFNCERARGRHP